MGAPFTGEAGAIQWFHPSSGNNGDLPQTSEGQVFLAGLLWPQIDTPQHIAQTVAASVTKGWYQDLAKISENAAGSLIRDGVLFLWVGFASNDSVFFRIDEDLVRWSTNPLDLVVSEDDLDPWALRRCCHGDDAFIYDQQKIQRVEQGHLVKLQPDSSGGVQVDAIHFDRFIPDSRMASGPLTMERVAQLTHDALVNAVHPLACSEKIGIMLSGGAGSAALAYALKKVGAHLIAYHIESQVPAGSEYYFAQRTCEALDVPLVHLPMSSGPDFLSPDWTFTHPDGHPWPRWFEQICERARQDDVTILVTGAGDDHAFGPEMEYGVHSILTAPIAAREKRSMLRGLLATDWNIFSILRSAWPWPPRQLIGLTYLAGPSGEDRQMRRADFLTPLPPYQRERDAALVHSPCFAPQSMAIEQTILQPHGIRLYYPYYHREIQAISLALPDAYRLMPRDSLPAQARRLLGMETIVDKPILRLACRNTPLPQEVVWRTWGVYTLASIQDFCINHRHILQDLLGNNSCLATMGILDSSRVKEVLASSARIRNNYTSLVASALVEIYLKNALNEQCKRGGPLWK